MTERPLNGRTVIEFGQLIPGPYAGRVLEDLGARVVKIEPPQGDAMRQFNPRLFAYLNAGKECISLDMKQARDRDDFRARVQGADAFIDGFRAGVCERLGAGYDELRLLNPKLVYVSISAFGRERNRPAHDINCEALSGVLHGYLHQVQPMLPIAPLANIFAGIMAAIHVISHFAEQSDRGKYLDLSMQHACAYGHAPLLLEGLQLQAGEAITPLGTMHAAVVHRCADGEWLAIATQEPWIWDRLMAVLGLSDLERIGYQTSGPGLAKGRAKLAECFAQAPREHWLRLLTDADLPVTPVLSPEEALTDMRTYGAGVVPSTPNFDFDGAFPLPNAVNARGQS
ncbi:CoA transferase [Pendulispora rubella]|uniref:CoA transferase n=1 Tax=Pendulispora rubella TaxID=2741070 RepID=A0ABZ2KV79_9BACT